MILSCDMYLHRSPSKFAILGMWTKESRHGQLFHTAVFLVTWTENSCEEEKNLKLTNFMQLLSLKNIF